MNEKHRKLLKYAVKNPHHVIFHPEQGVWNTYTRNVFGKYTEDVLFSIDTLLKVLHAVWRRLRAKDINICGNKVDSMESKVVYIDLGIYKEAKEFRRFVNWFGHLKQVQLIGIEANPKSFAKVERLLSSKRLNDNMELELINKAVVKNTNGNVFLYESDGGDGRSATLLSKSESNRMKVETEKLSNIIKKRVDNKKSDVLILRMNIEEAEKEVIEDLVESGDIKYVDGFYGMWDDLFKRDPEKNKLLRALKKDKCIDNFTFNSRDLGDRFPPTKLMFKLREWSIRYDIKTQIFRAIQS